MTSVKHTYFITANNLRLEKHIQLIDKHDANEGENTNDSLLIYINK